MELLYDPMTVADEDSSFGSKSDNHLKKHKEIEFNITRLKDVVDDLFKDQANNDMIQAKRKFANKCAYFLQAKTGEKCVGTIQWNTNFCKANVAEYTLKVKVPSKGIVNVKLVVDLHNCSCLADEESHKYMSHVFDDFVDDSCESHSEDLINLLSYWKEFTRSFRERGFSNLKLIFRDLNEQQVTFKSNRVKSTIMVHLNEKENKIVMFRVDEINKRTLANIILKLCGNEGAEQTTEQAGLRRLLQAFMTKLEADKVTSFTDVKLSLYGQKESSFHILAGKKDNPDKVIGFVDSKGEFNIHEKKTPPVPDRRRCTVS